MLIDPRRTPVWKFMFQTGIFLPKRIEHPFYFACAFAGAASSWPVGVYIHTANWQLD